MEIYKLVLPAFWLVFTTAMILAAKEKNESY